MIKQQDAYYLDEARLSFSIGSGGTGGGNDPTPTVSYEITVQYDSYPLEFGKWWSAYDVWYWTTFQTGTDNFLLLQHGR